jgi:hypothetical protein
MTFVNTIHRRIALLFTSSSLLVVLSVVTAFGHYGCFGSSTPGGGPGGGGPGVNPIFNPGPGSSGDTTAPSGAPVPVPTPEAGSAAAPQNPVDLPAPITGRLVIESPGGNNSCLVIGDQNAVPPNDLVLAVNDTQESSAESDWKNVFRLARLVDSFFPSASADLPVPDVCDTLLHPFHACGYAGPEGEFEFNLYGNIGDVVTLGIIDPATGDLISATVDRVIPPNIRTLPRRVNDIGHYADLIKLGPGTLYSLMPATEASPRGLVEIYDLTSHAAIDKSFIGHNPYRMDINAGHAKAALVDSSDNFATVVSLTSNNFDDTALPTASVFSPTDVALSFDAAHMVVSRDPDPVINALLEVIDTTTLSGVARITGASLVPSPPFPSGNVQAIETDAVAHSYYNYAGSSYIDLYAFVGIYQWTPSPPRLPEPATPYVGFLVHDAIYTVLNMFHLPAGCLPRDVTFDPENQLMVACGGTDTSQIVRVPFITSSTLPLSVSMTAPIAPLPDPGGMIKNPTRIASDGMIDGLNVGAFKEVYVTVQDGNASHPDSVIALSPPSYSPVKRSDVGLRPTGLAVPYDGQQVYVSTGVSHAVTNWSYDELTH